MKLTQIITNLIFQNKSEYIVKNLFYISITLCISIVLVFFSACNKVDDAENFIVSEEKSWSESEINQLVKEGLQEFSKGNTQEDNLPLYKNWLKEYKALSAEEFAIYIDINYNEISIWLKEQGVLDHNELAEEEKRFILSLNELSLENFGKPFNQLDDEERTIVEELYGTIDSDQMVSRGCQLEWYVTAIPVVISWPGGNYTGSWTYKDNEPNSSCDKEAEYNSWGTSSVKLHVTNGYVAWVTGGLNNGRYARWENGKCYVLFGSYRPHSAFYGTSVHP